jgi:hypothetical protein
VRKRLNGNQWFNYPLFLLGGPFTWFVPDNTYYVEVELLGSFYDLEAVQREKRLDSSTGRVLLAPQRIESLDRNFIGRSPNGLSYVTSIIVPSTFLARDSDNLQEDLVDDVLELASTGFARNVQQRRLDLVQADVAPFYLETDAVRIERVAGELIVRGVLYKDAARPEEMSEYVLTAGARSVRGELGAGREIERGGAQLVEHRFEARLPVDPEARTVSLDLVASERDQFVRTYTFRIPGGEGS